MKNLFFAFVFLLSLSAFAEEADEGKKGRVGPGKAVVEASEKDGLKLSEKALKNLELDFMAVLGGTNISVPASALVHFQDFSAIYRLRNGWFKMVEIEPTIRGQMAQFNSKDISSGDQIVISNPGFIRVIELDVFGPEADACAD